MEVYLTAEQEAELREAAANRGCGAEQLVTKVVERFLADEERDVQDLRAAIDQADAAIDAGHYTDYDQDTLQILFDRIKQRGAQALMEGEHSH